MKYWDNHCYCCNKELRNDPSYFTCEFDAYICEECHDRIIAGRWEGPEEEIIHNEFVSVSSSAAAPLSASIPFNLDADMPPQEFSTIFKLNGQEIRKDLFYSMLRRDAGEEYDEEEDFLGIEMLEIGNISLLRRYYGAEKFLENMKLDYITNLIDDAYRNGGVEINGNLYETIIQGE